MCIRDRLVTNKTYADIGIALRLHKNGYLGLYGSYVFQSSQDDQDHFFSNPTLAGRWTLYRNSESKLIPNFQILSSYAPNLVRQRSESQTQDLVDVFGSEFQEFSLGYDMWNDKNFIIGGVTQSFSIGLPRRVKKEFVRPGWSLSSSLTTGVKASSWIRLLTGYNHSYTHYRYDNDIKEESSRALNHGFFATLDLKVTDKDTMKLSLVSSGHFNAFNSTVNQTISLSYLKKWN